MISLPSILERKVAMIAKYSQSFYCKDEKGNNVHVAVREL